MRCDWSPPRARPWTRTSAHGRRPPRPLKPLGLRDTYLPGADPRILGPHNHGYQTMRLDDGTTGPRDVSVWGPTDGWAAGDIISTTADLERFTKALFQGHVVRGPLLREMFTLPKVADWGTGAPAAYSAGLSMKKLGGREVWGKTGGRWGYNTGIASTREGSRTLVHSVNSTDAKGQEMNEVARNIMVAAYGNPERSGGQPRSARGNAPGGTRGGGGTSPTAARVPSRPARLSPP